MQKFNWRKRPLIYILLCTVTLYLFLRVRRSKHEASVLLLKVQPMEAWEYVADFSNMKQLNPTLVDFSILNESGNYEHWKYSVMYSEYLSHWPYLENHATAYFDVKTNKENNIFYINSVHETCLLGGYFCVNSKSSFKFFRSSLEHTTCQENVEYECPAMFSSFCLREVEFQRNAIMNNLKLHFQKTI